MNFRAEVPLCYSVCPLVILSAAKNLNTPTIPTQKPSSRKNIKELHSNPFMFNNFELCAKVKVLFSSITYRLKNA